jgi:hypothetical protein
MDTSMGVQNSVQTPQRHYPAALAAKFESPSHAI